MEQTEENKVKKRSLRANQAYGRNKTLPRDKGLSKTIKINLCDGSKSDKQKR